YLDQGEFEKAIEHLSLALELGAGDKQIVADLGSAYFKLGATEQAREQWAKIIADQNPKVQDGSLYLRTLSQHGLAAEARARLKPLIIKWLNSVETSAGVRPLIYEIAKSFGKAQDNSEITLSQQDESARTALLRELCESAAKDIELPEMVIRERLVKRDQWA